VAEPSRIIGLLDCALVQSWPSLQNACVAFATKSDVEQFTAIGGTLAVVGGGALAFLKLVLPLLKKKPAKPAAFSNSVEVNPTITVSPVINPNNTQTINVTIPPAAQPTLGIAIDQTDALNKDDALLVIQRLAKKHGLSTEVAAEATKRFTDATDALPAAAQAINKPNMLTNALESLEQGRTYEAEGIFRQLAADKEQEGKASFKEAAEALRHLAAFSFINDKANALITLKRAAVLDPESYDIQRDLGDVARVAGDLAVAAEAYKIALSAAEQNQDERRVAGVLDRLVTIAMAQGKRPEAQTYARQAFEIARRRAEQEPDNFERKRDLSVSYDKIGDVLVAEGKRGEALISFRAGMAIAETLAKADSNNAEWQRDLLVSHDNIGKLLVAEGKRGEALLSYLAGMAIAETLAKSDPNNTEWQRDLLVFHNNIGDVLVAEDRRDEALQSFRACMAIAETLAKADPNNAQWQRDLSLSHNRIGDVLVAEGKRGEALLSFRVGLAIRETLAKADPDNAQWQRDLSVSHTKIGDVLVAQGKRGEALISYRAAMGIAETLAKADPNNAEWQRDLSVSHDRIGEALVAEGKRGEALLSFRAGMAIRETLAKADPSNAEWQRDLVVSYVKISGIDAGSAPELLQQALDVVKKLDSEGKLAPVHMFMVEELKKRLAAHKRVKS
jgi:tetratricopeptide (TPR) repeat protein